MPRNWRFWRNLMLIGAVHAIAITGLVRWSSKSKTSAGQSIVWLNGGPGQGSGPPVKELPPPEPANISTPPPSEGESKNETEEDHPVLASVKSDIQMPAATPAPSPKSTAKPALTPKPKVTPKPVAKTKPKSTPKSSPKKPIVAKALPKPKLTPKESKQKEEQKEQADVLEGKKFAKEAREKTDETDSSPGLPKTAGAQSDSDQATSASNGGHSGGTAGQSQFGWYGSMLHDRFYSEWVQPTMVASSGEKYSVLLKLRIEKDGRVSSFEMIKPSGNATVDESVATVAKRVTQVDPLPAGLGNGGHYDVRINFELNSEQ